MKQKEFENIKDEIVSGREVIIKYFTYHKDVQANIVGVISPYLNGVNKMISENGYYFTVELKHIDDPHNLFKFQSGIMRIFNFQNKKCCNLYSPNIISIKTGSLLSFKVKRLTKNIKLDG